MEQVLGHEGAIEPEPSSSSSAHSHYKLVPWLSWDEWDIVRVSLFSSSPQSVASALRRISAWRSRGCLPVAVEVTAAIIEIQQKDPVFRKDLPLNAFTDSDEILAMLYCMAIMRLVNGVVEKTRKKKEISIADAASAIGIPRMLIDIRHEGSHRDLPALPLVRDASIKALNWLKSYYWDPQKNVIPNAADIARVRKEIKSQLQELALCLKMKHSPHLGSSIVRERCIQPCGRNKILSHITGQVHLSKHAGSRKISSKILKGLRRLYSSFSSEVVSVLLEFFLKVINSDQMELPQDQVQALLDEWKPLISKFSNKEPQLLADMLKAILEMIATQDESGLGAKSMETQYLSALFSWTLMIARELNFLYIGNSLSEAEVPSAKRGISMGMLKVLLRKCLLAARGNKQLMESAEQLALVVGGSSLADKVKKLNSLVLRDWDLTEGSSSQCSSDPVFCQNLDSIQLAAQQLELIKHCRMKKNIVQTTDGDVQSTRTWNVAQSWNPCPIGMLPSELGFSGHLPVLESKIEEVPEISDTEREEIHELDQSNDTDYVSQGDKRWELNWCAKRALSDNDFSGDSETMRAKKLKQTQENSESKEEDASTGMDGCLLVNGVLKKVGREELESMKSALWISI